MALTLNMFLGAETGTINEIVNGTTTYLLVESSSPRTGAYHFRQVTNGSSCSFVTEVADAGSGYIFGFARRRTSGSAGSARMSLANSPSNPVGSTQWTDETGSLQISGVNGNTTTLRIANAAGTTLTDISSALSDADWDYIEVYHSDWSTSATVEVFVNGTSVYSASGIDTKGTSTARPTDLSINQQCSWDDIYVLTGATSASQRLNQPRVKGYKSNVASATDNGSALDSGTWNSTGSVPWADASSVTYSTNGAAGTTDTDTSTPNTGPSGDSDITGATIYGARWIIRAARTAGSNSTPFLTYGDTGGTTNTGDILTTSAADYAFLSESTNVPSASQYFRVGGGKNSGGRDVTIYDAMGMLLYVPNVGPTYTLTAGAGSFSESGVASGVTAARKLTGAAGSYTWTGVAAALSKGYVLTADAGSFTLTGVSAAMQAARVLTADVGTYTIGGVAAGLSASRNLVADAGSFALSGQSVLLPRGYTVTADVGSYAISGQAASLVVARNLVAGSGAFTLTGNAAAFARGYTLTAAQGAFTISGQAAALVAARTIAAGAGAYTLTGIDAVLTYTPVGGPTYTLTAAQGTFTLTGQAAVVTAQRNLAASAGAYTLTGQAAGLQVSRTLTAGAGSFTLTGNAAGIAAGRKLLAEAGGYTVTGVDAGLTYTPASTPAVTPVSGGWIDPKVARRLLREARALQKAQEDQERDRRAEIERRRQAINDTLERTYAEITGTAPPQTPEEIIELVAAPKPATPTNQAADAIAAYLALLSMGDVPGMGEAIEAMDRALLAMRVAAQEADDEEVLLLAAY